MDLKKEVLNDGSFNLYLSYRRAQYSASVGDCMAVQEIPKPDLEQAKFRECERIYSNTRGRSKRLRSRVDKWLTVPGQLYFITLTFSDEAFNRSSPSSRKKAVQRFLSSFDGLYVANIDFGNVNEREHYHGLLFLKDKLSPGKPVKKGNLFFLNPPEFEFWNQRYGFSCVQQVGLKDLDSKRVTKYISKLSNHALKETSASPRLIYSRKDPDWFFEARRCRKVFGPPKPNPLLFRFDGECWFKK